MKKSCVLVLKISTAVSQEWDIHAVKLCVTLIVVQQFFPLTWWWLLGLADSSSMTSSSVASFTFTISISHGVMWQTILPLILLILNLLQLSLFFPNVPSKIITGSQNVSLPKAYLAKHSWDSKKELLITIKLVYSVVSKLCYTRWD